MKRVLIYQRICDFKSSGSAILNGINYANVVAQFLYDESFSGLFKKIIFSMFWSTEFVRQGVKESDLLIFYSCRNKKRKDYDYVPDKIFSILDSRCDYVDSVERLSFFNVFFVFMGLPKAWLCTRGYKANRAQRLGCAFLISKYMTAADRAFSPLLSGKKKLVTFCDAQAPENLMAQLAKMAGIKTFTNQHGQYRILDKNNISPDVEAYENFVSEYMFCWGEATRNEFSRVGFDAGKFIVTGWIRKLSKITPHPPRGALGVMLNGENARDSNIALLNAAKLIGRELNLNYFVRLHPWSKVKDYIGFLDDRCSAIGHYDLPSYLSKVDFSIAHMSGATIEVLCANSLVYLLDDGKLAEVFRVEGLSFDSYEAIVEAVSKDRAFPEMADQRVNALCKWFNDDGCQEMRIRESLMVGCNSHGSFI